MPGLQARDLPIQGMKLITFDQRQDNRGWFAESWQKEKFLGIGMPNFNPVQSNVSFNSTTGVLRGMHAEPWNKLVTIVSGEAFLAWVDIREGENFGKTHYLTMLPGQAVFVPTGVANGYQTLRANTVYSYLVDSFWEANKEYVGIDPIDSALAIPWPIRPTDSLLSKKDMELPKLGEIKPWPLRKVVILGATGQIGREVAKVFPRAKHVSQSSVRKALDASEFASLIPEDSIVINCAAWTNVDAAEEPKNHNEVFRINTLVPLLLAMSCESKGATLVHYSSDYIFDGSISRAYSESDPPSPLNNYGWSKMTGDYSAAHCTRHYVIRTSWVFGAGKNFIDTVFERLSSGERVAVVDDQFGRPTSAAEIAKFTKTLLDGQFPYGSYNFTGDGLPTSWFGIADFIAKATGLGGRNLTRVSSKSATRTSASGAQRPSNSVLDLTKIHSLGIRTADWRNSVMEHLLIKNPGSISKKKSGLDAN